MNGTLRRHLVDANERAENMLQKLIAEMAAQEGVTERLKAVQPFEWVRRMNSIRNRAEEIIMEEVIRAL